MLPVGADVGLADCVEVGGEGALGRIEVASVRGLRIGAANEFELGDVVGRRHAGVRRVELVREVLALQKALDLADALGNNETRPFGPLREDVPHGQPMDRAIRTVWSP